MGLDHFDVVVFIKCGGDPFEKLAAIYREPLPPSLHAEIVASAVLMDVPKIVSVWEMIVAKLLGDFNMDRSYPSNEDSIETIVGLSPGVTYTFTGFDEWGDGWDENGWFEVIVTTVDGGPMEVDDVAGRRILGGPTTGQVEGSGGVARPFTMPAECGGVGECTVAIRIAAHRAGNEISWELRDTTDDSVVGYGPRSAPLYLGAMPSSEPSSGPCPGGSVCASNGQILVDLFVGELGSVVAWRWDRGFDPSCVWQTGPMSNQASAATGQGGAWSQVTPVVTTSATSLDGSWNTYRLIASLEPTAAEKLYSIYGTPESPMSVPAAFQAAAPFGANIAGVNPGFFALSAEAEFDSWLTVGVTRGSAGGLSALSSIGIPFASWTVDSGIETTAGSVFWLNPPDAPGGDVVVAQLTVGRGAAVTCAFGLMGTSPGGADDWQADNVLWTLAPPAPTPPPPPPPPSSGRVEVVSTSGVAGMTTVRLTITLSATQSNVYAMFGTGDTPMFFPPAYQVSPPFGADVGGINPAFFAFANNDQTGYAEFDSWLTIGVTDGSAPGAIAGSPGFDLGAWTETTGISETDAAIFYMDPSQGPSGSDIVMAQMTLSAADAASGSASALLQGRVAGSGEDWRDSAMWTWEVDAPPPTPPPSSSSESIAAASAAAIAAATRSLAPPPPPAPPPPSLAVEVGLTTSCGPLALPLPPLLPAGLPLPPLPPPPPPPMLLLLML